MKTIFLQKHIIFKSVMLLISAFVIGVTAQAQEVSASAKGVLDFETTVIDYGTIEKNSNGDRTFTFKNKGRAPIVITDIKTSCGCTVASKPNAAVMPGQTAEIGVTYKTSRVGAFTKTITVLSNAVEPRKILKIKGVVVDSENKLGK